jgi:hypothetical protein
VGSFPSALSISNLCECFFHLALALPPGPGGISALIGTQRREDAEHPRFLERFSSRSQDIFDKGLQRRRNKIPFALCDSASLCIYLSMSTYVVIIEIYFWDNTLEYPKNNTRMKDYPSANGAAISQPGATAPGMRDHSLIQGQKARNISGFQPLFIIDIPNPALRTGLGYRRAVGAR